MSTRATIPLLAALCSVVLGCAHGGVGSAEGWSVVRSKHFTIYTQRPRDIQLVVTDLELAHSTIGGGFFQPIDLPSVDVLVLTPEAFGQLMGFRRSSVTLASAPGTSGIGESGLLILENDEGASRAAEALAHLYIARSFPKAPLWFHEGFAAYLRTVIYREGDKGRLACFGLLPAERETVLPLEKVLAMGWEEYDSDEARGWYRYTTRVLIDFILHGAEGKNAPRMRPLVEAISEGRSARESFDAAFPSVPLSFLDKKLQEHAADLSSSNTRARRGLCPLPRVLPPQRAVDHSPPRITAAPTDKLKLLLDALLKLPRREGYPPWYPPDIVASSGTPG